MRCWRFDGSHEAGGSRQGPSLESDVNTRRILASANESC